MQPKGSLSVSELVFQLFKGVDCTDKSRALLLRSITQRSRLGSFTAHAAEAARYNFDGTKSMSASIPMTKNPQMVRGYRDEIALHIIREAKRLHPQAILFHFNSRIQKVDLDKRTVHASTAESASAQVRCQHGHISGSLGYMNYIVFQHTEMQTSHQAGLEKSGCCCSAALLNIYMPVHMCGYMYTSHAGSLTN